MKDEIKEILEALRDSIDDTGTDKVNFINWVDKIEDYITNLEEKYERMKENAEILSNGYDELVKQKEKAIELIKKDREKSYDSLEKKAFYCNKTDKLLNILEGDDKSE